MRGRSRYVAGEMSETPPTNAPRAWRAHVPWMGLTALVGAVTAGLTLMPGPLRWVEAGLAVAGAAVLGGGGLLVLGVVRRNGWAAAGAVVPILVGGACAGWLLLLSAVSSLVIEDVRDPFTDGLVVPEGYPMREPLDEPPAHMAPTDPRGQAFVDGLRSGADDADAEVVVRLEGLRALDEAGATRLRQRLAQSRLWHMGFDGRDDLAYRRLPDERGLIADELHGFYRLSDPVRHHRVAIGFAGEGLEDDGPRLTTVAAGAGRVRLGSVPSQQDRFRASVLRVTSPRVVVEIFEEGPAEGRPATRAALALLEATLAGEEREGAIRPEGGPAIELTRGFQGGIFQVWALINPGEPGQVYVQAHEAIRDLRLSADRMRTRTMQTAPYSDDPAERFVYSSDFTIYEGDWGDYYPARIAVWFVPDDGGPERKLVEGTFRVDGWMR